MLKNRRYLDEYKFKKTLIPNAFEPIVPQALFDEVQRRIESNKKGSAKHKAKKLYLLTDNFFAAKMMKKWLGIVSAAKRE